MTYDQAEKNAAEDEAGFFQKLDEAYEHVDRLFGTQVGEAVLASLTAAAVLILRGQCIRASFTLPYIGQALLLKDSLGRFCVRRRRERTGVRG